MLLSVVTYFVPTIERSRKGKFRDIAQHANVLEWSLHLSVGLILIAVFVISTSSTFDLPAWLLGPLYGWLSGLLAFLLMRPPTLDDSPGQELNLRTLAVSLGIHLIMGFAVTATYAVLAA